MAARIESAIQASRFHYERTGRCFYITEEIVKGRTSFEELEEFEQFWDPGLLLPEKVTREQVFEEHIGSLEAAGALLPGYQLLSDTFDQNFQLGSQLNQAFASQSQNTFSQGQPTTSMNVDGNTMFGCGYSPGINPMSKFVTANGIMPMRNLSTLISLDQTKDLTNPHQVMDLTSDTRAVNSFVKQEKEQREEFDFSGWLVDTDESEGEENPLDNEEQDK